MSTRGQPADLDARAAGVRVRLRHRLILLSVLPLVLVSFGFTALTLRISRGWVEEDLRERAIAFAREVAATIADRRELENAGLLRDQIRQILTVRQNVLQIDILVFGDDIARIVATSHAARRLPFTREETQQVHRGRVLSRLVEEDEGRYWEVLAPINLQGAVEGAVAATFSLDRADRQASRIRRWSFAMTAASVLLTGLLVGVTIRLVVDRPIQQFMDAIRRLRSGDGGATVDIGSRDEFGLLAQHFNAMIARVTQFNEDLRARVAEATAALDARYREVERLNTVLFEAQRRLSHAERLAISGRVMAEVAHEVGTPLHSVAGHLELLRRDLPPELAAGPLARRLAIIETEVARMTGIIAQLLDLTRPAPGDPAPVDLNRVLRDTADLVRPGLAAAGLALEIAADPAMPAVSGHATQLQQVVLNLLTNAIDATPAGGRVEVAARLRSAGDEVEVTVSDTGPGISPADQKQIFEPFFSTKERGRGTGLGLFISAQIVRDHRGRIEVESEEGHGSRFRVILPVAGRPS